MIESLNCKIYTSFNTQALEIKKLKFNKNTIQANFKLLHVNYQFPTPIKFIMLRFLSITFFKSMFIGNIIKKFLAKYLIKRRNESNFIVIRNYKLGKKFFVKSNTLQDKKLKILKNDRNFSNMHMASQGYWQLNEDIS
jgi:hypothetical protein